jgi:hypothetical protein
MGDKIKTIFIYLLVIFMAIFIGSGIFLVLNKKTVTEKKTASASAAVPTVSPDQGSLDLTSETEKVSLTASEELKINLVADSNGKNVVGYDLALSYDPTAFKFVDAVSDLTEFNINKYVRENYVSFLAVKSLQNQTPTIFNQTKIISFIFTPIKTGKFSFSLQPLLGRDKTDLVTDKTEVINPKLNKLEIEVY